MLQLTLSAIDEHFVSDLVDIAITATLGDDIRDEATFTARAAEARGELYTTVAELADNLETLIEQRQKVIEKLDDLPKTAHEDIEFQLDYLFRPGFLKTEALLGRYPRYLRALLLRIDRLTNNSAGDQNKLADVEPFQNRLTEAFLAKEDLSAAYDLLELAMMLEEFRINRFAPEVRTDGKISAKRLEKMFER